MLHDWILNLLMQIVINPLEQFIAVFQAVLVDFISTWR
jgi:hypothetical protein